MRNAYALLGVTFLIVAIGAAVLINEAHAPEVSNGGVVPESEKAHTISNASSAVPMSLKLISPAFLHDGKIPSKYTCEGDNVNPELQISGVPEGAKSLVLVMDDPDIPQSVKDARGIEKFDHWVLYNIMPETSVIPEGAFLLGNNMDASLGQQGFNSRGEASYIGPCPPDREHRYIYRLYALSGTLNFIQTPTLDEVEMAAEGMMLAEATLIGRYEKMNKQ